MCMNYDHNKKFGLLKFHSGYGKFYFNSPKGYNRKIINAQTVCIRILFLSKKLRRVAVGKVARFLLRERRFKSRLKPKHVFSIFVVYLHCKTESIFNFH